MRRILALSKAAVSDRRGIENVLEPHRRPLCA
jgi:hypothetical protein